MYHAYQMIWKALVWKRATLGRLKMKAARFTLLYRFKELGKHLMGLTEPFLRIGSPLILTPGNLSYYTLLQTYAMAF